MEVTPAWCAEEVDNVDDTYALVEHKAGARMTRRVARSWVSRGKSANRIQ